MRFIYTALLSVFGLFLLFSPAQAQETDITIRVKAHDAMFIGNDIGGAYVEVRDKRTGDVIASGITIGQSGDQDTIMAESVARDAVLSSEDTAHFRFSIDLFEPLPVVITATGPLGQPQASVKSSREIILIPGKNYSDGDGVVVEMYGLAVDVLMPPANSAQEFSADERVTILANIINLDGSQPAEDGPWSAERYDVEAHIYQKQIFLATVKLPYNGRPGQFGTNLKLKEASPYKIIVTVFDKVTKEAGMDATTVRLTPPAE